MKPSRIRHTLTAASSAVVMLASASVVLTAASGPAAADQGRAGVNFAAEAQRVARSLVSASTSAGRAKAIESLFSALGVQTIDYQGHAVTRRLAGGMNLYVYPYEVTLNASRSEERRVGKACRHR